MPGVLSIECNGYGFELNVATKAVGDIMEKLGSIDELKTPTGYVIIHRIISGEAWSRLVSLERH